MTISTTTELAAELAAGRMVVLVDDEDRENEGDVILAAEHSTPEAINFMAKHCRGLICLTLTRARCEQLALPPMVKHNGTKHGTAFTVSIEAVEGVDTGISAADRSQTIQAAVAKNAKASDLVSPGHVFPLQAADGGVLMRAGHTEAGCDLAAMAGLEPAAVICEVMNDDGTMARLPDLIEFAKKHNLKIGTIAQMIEHRSQQDALVVLKGERSMRTAQGTFRCQTFRDIRVGVGDGQAQPVGRIGAGQAGQLQQAAHHLLHLAFGGAAVAHHGFFHLQRGVFGHRQVAATRAVMAGAARLAQQQGGLRVDVDEHDFHRGHIGLVALHHFAMPSNSTFSRPGRSPRASVVVRMVPLAT
jgi:3,4-dihydroxy-2-butanone 4-phosphate synthase